jgi:hypothetical protein
MVIINFMTITIGRGNRVLIVMRSGPITTQMEKLRLNCDEKGSDNNSAGSVAIEL